MNKIHTKKVPINIKGTVHHISELIEIKRQEIPNLKKILLIVETPDGQIFYPEIRNKKVHLIKKKEIKIGSTVEISILFQGSEKNGKLYNNIFVSDINKI